MTQQKTTSVDQAQSPYFFGIDVGGTGIKIGLTDDQGATLGYSAIDTLEPQGPADAMRRVAEACRAILDKLGLDAPRFLLTPSDAADNRKG